MRVVNKTDSPMYSKLARAQLMPGRASRDLGDFASSVRGFLERGFHTVLSDDDFAAIADVLRSDEAGRAVVGTKPAIDMTGRAYETRRLVEQSMARSAKQSDAIARANAREKAAEAETNALDASGNPVAREAAVSTGPLRSELHPEMGTDVDDVFANNRAVIEMFRNAPHTIVAGTTKVSHNPDDYARGTGLPPGVPDFPDAASSVRAASVSAKGGR